MSSVRLVYPGNGERDDFQKHLTAVFLENRQLLRRVRSSAFSDLLEEVIIARKIFFSAQGRAGYVLRCFCMRLMHLDYQVYFCGDTVTPAIEEGDLLIVLSGSGDTAWTLDAVKSARSRYARTLGILGNADSAIGRMVDRCIVIPGTTKLRRNGEPSSVQISGSLFEQAAFFFLEATVLELSRKRAHAGEDLLARHAVVE
jgi:6-phospho-3-hexuloisomerase